MKELFVFMAYSLIVAFALAGFGILGCSATGNPLLVEPPETTWDTSVTDEDTGEEAPDTDTDVDADTDTDTDADTDTDTDTDTDIDTDTGPAPQPPQNKIGCRDGFICLIMGNGPLDCIARTDAQAKKVMTDLVGCLTMSGCMGDLQNPLNLITCALGQCGQHMLTCLVDN